MYNSRYLLLIFYKQIIQIISKSFAGILGSIAKIIFGTILKTHYQEIYEVILEEPVGKSRENLWTNLCNLKSREIHTKILRKYFFPKNSMELI